jgi:hypothetical protein
MPAWTRDVALKVIPAGPDGFERYWLWAEIALGQQIEEGLMMAAAIDYAVARVPDEPRFVLARAVIADQRLLRDPQIPAAGTRLSARSESMATSVLSAHDDALARPCQQRSGCPRATSDIGPYVR